MNQLASQRTRSVRLSEKSYFGPELFGFFRELEKNNNREWFTANKERYESHVRDPFLRFIADFGSRLPTISKNFNADPRPVGGSMFRIYRDTRFSRDKSSYKTTVAAHFPHRAAGRDVHAPGFYLHIEPGNCMGGGGLWHPDGPALVKVRDRIVNRTKEWKAVVDSGILILGDTLKRPPSGYDPEHPFVEDVKRKDFYTMSKFSDVDVCASDFMNRYLDACRTAVPLVQFLTKALGLAW